MSYKKNLFLKILLLCACFSCSKSLSLYQGGHKVNKRFHSKLHRTINGKKKQKIRLVDINTLKPLNSEKVLVTLDFPPYYYDGPSGLDYSRYKLDTLYPNKNGEIFLPYNLFNGSLSCRIYMSSPYDNNDAFLSVRIDSNKITQFINKFRSQLVFSEITHLITPKEVKRFNLYTETTESNTYETINIYVSKDEDRISLLRNKLESKKQYYEKNQDILWDEIWMDFEKSVGYENLKLKPTPRIWHLYSRIVAERIANLKLTPLINKYHSSDIVFQKYNLLVGMVTLKIHYEKKYKFMDTQEIKTLEGLIEDFYVEYEEYTDSLSFLVKEQLLSKDFLTRLLEGFEY